MPWPCPTSWLNAAKRILQKKERDRRERQRAKNLEAGSSKPVKVKDGVQDFVRNAFREKFYQIIGHHAVIGLRDCTTNLQTGNPYTEAEFFRALGINKSQQGRWRSEKTFVEADNFFAFQMLILQKPLSQLSVPNNSAILRQSMISHFNFLAVQFGNESQAKPTVKEIGFLTAVMTIMRRNKDAVYNHLVAAERTDARLSTLAKLITSRTEPEEELRATKDAVRIVLKKWGIAYSLFALAYSARWPNPEVAS